MTSAFRLFYMSVWRNFLQMLRYRLNFVFELLTGLLFGAGMLIFSLAFNKNIFTVSTGTDNLVAFIILGVSFLNFQNIALWGASNLFRGELSTGQIDYTFTSPFSRYSYIFSNVAALGLQQVIFFIPIFSVGLWFSRETLTASGLVLGLLAVLLSVAALSQLGAIFGALALRVQQVTAVFTFFNLSFQVFTGMFIPLQIFPEWVQWIGLLAFPQSSGMDLLRHYLLGTIPVASVRVEWIILIGQFIVFGLLAIFAVKRLERTARVQGLHYL